MKAAAAKKIPAPHAGPSPASRYSQTKMGIAAKRAIVSTFGIEPRILGQDTRKTYVRCPGSVARVAGTLRIPGFVNAHSHTFQRSLRGRAAGGDFWAWRDVMLAEAERQTPDLVRAEYELGYRELLAAGYTAVGEFHYLGVAEAHAAVEAAAAAGIEVVLLLVAYARGGLPRFRQESVSEYLGQVESLRKTGLRVGLAPHSVRACPAAWLEEIGRYAASEALPLHIHADEQPKEIEECLAEHGCRPIELLARAGCLTERTTIVHATHADGAELDLLASHGSTICACPTTEADLGDGFLPAERIRKRAIPLCIGSDDGARSLGLEAWREIEVDLAHRSLAGVAHDDVTAALVAGCGADVVVAQD